MKKCLLGALACAGAFVVSNCTAQGFADAFFSYVSGTGFSAGFTNPATVLGQPTNNITPFSPAFRNTQILSLGAGGSITVGFNAPIHNDAAHPFGMDFTIFGNAGFVITNGDFSGGGITDGSLLGNNAGSTRVSVSADNVTFYALNPLLARTVDGLFPTDGIGDFHRPVDPSLTPGNFNGKNLAGIRGLYGGSAGGTSYDISWAQDAMGNDVFLSDISYVKVDVVSGKSEIDGFAIVAVPEPGTSTILIMGLLILSFGRRWVGRGAAFAMVTVLAGATIANAGTFSENFATDPSSRWEATGNTNLFHWNPTNYNMDVTWDSSQPNSYYYRPLGTILGIADSFSLQFDVRMSNAVATGDGFETAIGFLNIGDAMKPEFRRGTGSNSPNVFEFNLFPDTGFGPSITASVADTNSHFEFLFDFVGLDNGVDYHVEMAHTAGETNFAVTVYTNYPANPGIYSTMPFPFVSSNFTDFRVDTVAISSYYDGGSGSSIMANGTIGNITVTTPPPPVQVVSGGLTNGVFEIQLTSMTNWSYTLERTAELQSWTNAAPSIEGNGGIILLQDPAPPPDKAFYRVRANRL